MKKIILIVLISLATASITKANPKGNVVGYCTQLALNTSNGNYDMYKDAFNNCIETFGNQQ